MRHHLPPCSVCGSRRQRPECNQCALRTQVLAGSAEEQHRFFDAERVALMQKPRTPVELAGMPLTVALVSCGAFKRKEPGPHRAADLYIGRLFKLAFWHAIDHHDDVMILSALHGLVPPHQELEPYDYAMHQMTRQERGEWGKTVVGELMTHYPMTRLQLTLFAGQAYTQPVVAAISRAHIQHWGLSQPLQGLDLFERMAWFKRFKEEDS